MLYYDRIDVSEGIDINKIRTSRKCDIFHYWCFVDNGFKFQLDDCNGCHDILMMSVDLYDIATLNINGAD